MLQDFLKLRLFLPLDKVQNHKKDQFFVLNTKEQPLQCQIMLLS